MHRLVLLLGLLGAAACKESPPPADPPAVVSVATVPGQALTAAPASMSSFDDPLHPHLPQVRSLADLKRHDGEKVELHGRYEVTPAALGKAPNVTFIVLADGERIVRAYRPPEDELMLQDQQVVVIGTVSTTSGQPGYVQQLGGPHITSVAEISLHPLVSPHHHDDVEIVTPPTLASASQLASHENHWVQVFATVKALEPLADAGWVRVVLTLPDGGDVAVAQSAESLWDRHRGQAISVIARVGRDGKDLVGVGAICAGRVERCGMSGRKR